MKINSYNCVNKAFTEICICLSCVCILNLSGTQLHTFLIIWKWTVTPVWRKHSLKQQTVVWSYIWCLVSVQTVSCCTCCPTSQLLLWRGWPRDAYPHQLVTVCRTEIGPALSENNIIVPNTESSLTVCSVCVRQDRANEASFTRLGSGRCEKKIVVSLACPGRTLSFFWGMVERNRTSAHLRSFA